MPDLVTSANTTTAGTTNTTFPPATTSAQNPLTVTSQTPGYLLPYAVNAAQAGQQLLTTPYTPYGGQRVAGASDLTNLAATTAAGSGVSSAVGAAPTVTASLLSGLTSAPTSFTDSGIASMYMNPYMTNVLDVQQQRAQREYQQAMRDYGLKAASRGAFGGSRQGIGEAALGEGYMRNLNELTAKGLASAYSSAQDQFNKEQEAARARTALGFQGAEQLGKQGMQEQQATRDYIDMLTKMGSSEEARRQKQLDIDYQNFLEQRQYPEQQLTKFVNVLNALPKGTVTEQRTAADPFAAILPQILTAFTDGGGSEGLAALLAQLFGTGDTAATGTTATDGATSGTQG